MHTGAHVSAPVRGVLPQNYFVLHALRLILMQSGQRNVDEMKYTIANITMNIIVSLLSQAARMSPSSIRQGWRRGPQHSGLPRNLQSRLTRGLTTPIHVELLRLAS